MAPRGGYRAGSEGMYDIARKKFAMRHNHGRAEPDFERSGPAPAMAHVLVGRLELP